MRRVKSKNTRPEMVVRRLAYSLGFRYRLHVAELPGKPDLVFIGKKKAIFVHGCFWHWHEGCRGARMPEANRDYWVDKIGKNIVRDKKSQLKLKDMGWDCLVVWECQVKNIEELGRTISAFLEA